MFDDEGLVQLAAIDFWREAGFTIKEMAALLNDMGTSMEAVKKIASARIAELDETISHAEHVKKLLFELMECGHQQLNECPYYQSILRQRADKILMGDYQGFTSRRTSHPPG